VKATSIWMAALWIAGVGAVSAIPACQKETSAADKAAADKTAAQPPDLVEMKAEITRMTAHIDVTMAKLDTLMAATGDLAKPNAEALAAMETLETEAQVLKKRGDQMRERGAAYFEVWERQLASMSTPDVTAIATKRKEELAGEYAEVLLAMQETRAALDAYLGDMKTIHTAVEDGMTPEKQKLLAPQVKAAKDKATTLKSRVDVAFTKLGQVSQIYAKH